MITGKSITPCEGESTVRSYVCTTFNDWFFGLKAQGILEVTNKRLVFQALGEGIKGWSVIHNEVAIADVSDLKIYKGTSFSLMKFILGLVLAGIVASAVMALAAWMGLLKLSPVLGLAAFGYMAYRAYVWAKEETFSLKVATKGGGGQVVNIAGQSPLADGSSVARRALVGAPGPDSQKLMKELGAVVLDIQNLGDYGIDKWKKVS